MRALITGASGQDSWYLTKLLRGKGYEVYGIQTRHAQEPETPEGMEVLPGDITDSGFVRDVVESTKPDEFYNLAALTHVGLSFDIPESYIKVNTIGALNCLEAAYRVGCKFYQASTSELFGDALPPQNELTEMRPRSPYGVSKLAAHWLAKNFRERGLYAVTGILFNHESPKRGRDFVSRKVCEAAGKRQPVVLGNLEARRDWGHAEDYVFGMWLMMQQPKADDYVLATGETRTVAELCEAAYRVVGLDWKEYVTTDDKFLRPLEVEHLRGDPSKAQRIGWQRKWCFEAMIFEMVNAASSQ